MKPYRAPGFPKIGKVLAGFILWFLLGRSLLLWAADYPAVLGWEKRVELSTPVSGIVVEVSARVGERVKKGQSLLKLDERPFRIELDRARSEVRRLSVALDEARREKERAEELYARTVLSDHELQLARIGWTTADTRLESARADLDRARLNLEYSVIRAPYDGIVLNRHVEVGQTIVNRLQSTPLLVLAETGRMRAHLLLSQEQLLTLASGEKAMVKVKGRTYPGSVLSIGLTPESGKSGAPLYGVDISFHAGSTDTFREGQPATVSFPEIPEDPSSW